MALAMSSAASAATMRANSIDPPEDLVLADLVEVDPLGYPCIREDEIDIAFHASGKGVRLPRTCLPEPCRAALSQVQLASLIGRPPFPAEWDDYYSRYADYCRKEVVPFDDAAAAEEIGDPVAFWSPLVASYPANAPIRDSLSGVRVGDGGIGGFPSDPTPPPTDPGGILDDPEDGPTDDPDPIPHAPLPAGLVLALSGLACLLLGRRRKSSP